MWSPCLIPAHRLSSMRYLSSVSRARVNTTSPKISDSFFSNLRLQVIQVLTSSLAQDQRQTLLSSIGALDKETAEQQKRSSIGEAVAKAMAQEATKRETLQQQEEDKIIQRAQHAMEQRIMNDLVIQERQQALERWKRELKVEEEQEEKATSTPMVQEPKETTHPILGPMLHDLGYKRIHITSAKALSAIPIWSQQRSYRHDRAKIMAADKLKSMDLGLPGVISLHEAEDGTLSILDGQHRVGMLTILQDKSKNTMNLNEILVEVFPQSHASSPSTLAEDLFIEINKAEPVKLVDMPRVAKSKDKDVIDEAASQLLEAYPEMFKPSQRCRPPHLNVDNLRDAIFTANILKNHSITSSSALYNWILKRNKELEKMYSKEEEAFKMGVSPSALEKAKEFKFYIGLDLSWLHKSV